MTPRPAPRLPSSVAPTTVGAVLATWHPLADVLAALRIDELELALNAFDSMSRPYRHGLDSASRPARTFARVSRAIRAEIRAALAARRLDPVARAADPVSAAFEERVLRDADEAERAAARLAWQSMLRAQRARPVPCGPGDGGRQPVTVGLNGRSTAAEIRAGSRRAHLNGQRPRHAREATAEPAPATVGLNGGPTVDDAGRVAQTQATDHRATTAGYRS